MNDIQKNYLVGLILKKIEKYDLDAMKDFNVDDDRYIENINVFIEEYATNTELINNIYKFLSSDEILFTDMSLIIEKVGLFIRVKNNDRYFVISEKDFTNLIITTKCYLSDCLPLGSVVKLKDGSTVVIEQRMVQQKGKDFYYDYRVIPYPMGVFNEQMYVHCSNDDIDSIIFNGYSDPENEGYELALKESFIDNDVFEYNCHEALLNM